MSTRFQAAIRLDEFDSDGCPGAPLVVRTGRPMALKLSNDAPLWYGFVVLETTKQADVVPIGSDERAVVAFINDVDAIGAFRPGASYLIGDGRRTVGVIRLLASIAQQ